MKKVLHLQAKSDIFTRKNSYIFKKKVFNLREISHKFTGKNSYIYIFLKS